MRPPLNALLVATLAAATVGCGGNGDGDTSSLSDGRHYGYIQAVDTSSAPATISVDIAEFLTGEEATRAAVEDGVIAEGETVPNDYYVRNEDRAVLVIPIVSDVAVTRIQCNGGCGDGYPGELEAFAASFDDPGPKSLTDEYRGSESQYWVTVQGSQVVAIEEQYLP